MFVNSSILHFDVDLATSKTYSKKDRNSDDTIIIEKQIETLALRKK